MSSAMTLDLKIACYTRVSGAGPRTIEIVYHNPGARDRLLQSTAQHGVYRLAMTVPVRDLRARGRVGPKLAAYWERTCALRGAMHAWGAAALC